VITVTALAAWLSELSLGVIPFTSGEFIPPGPDRLGFLLPTGGKGTSMERLFDDETFSFHIRGRKGSYGDAESLAQTIDQLVMQAVAPVYIGGQFVNDLGRISPPRFQGWDAARRSNFLGVYYFNVAL